MEQLHIGLVGRKGAGKNCAADFVKAEHAAFHITAFADPLRDVCKIIFGLTDNEMSDRALKEAELDRYPFVSPRTIMQKVGTDCIRTHFPDAWMSAWRCRVKPFPCTITVDVRFPNEAAAIRDLGGKIIRIRRPEVETPDAHVSETAMDDIVPDKVVMNDGSPQLLKARILAVVAELQEGK